VNVELERLKRETRAALNEARVAAGLEPLPAPPPTAPSTGTAAAVAG
jgi:hypothetical protein